MATPTDYSVTPDDLIVEIREMADAVDLETRHSDALILRMVNRAMRRLRSKLTGAGFSYFLVATAAAALPTSPASSGEQYLEIDFPEGAYQIHGVDVRCGDTWYPLRPASFSERRDYQGRYGFISSGLRGPEVFIIRTVATEDDDALAAGKIMIMPLDTQGLDHRVWYLPSWVDITEENADTYVIYGHDLWLEWVRLEVALGLHSRDNDSLGAIAELERKQGAVWLEIVRTSHRVQSSGPTVVRSRRRGRRGRAI